MNKLNLLIIAMLTMSIPESVFSASKNEQVEIIRPLLTSKQLSNIKAIDEENLNKIKANISELDPDNLNKEINNGEDLFNLDMLVSDGSNRRSRRDEINHKIKGILETTINIGKGIYDIVLSRIIKIRNEVEESTFFTKYDKDGNYKLLLTSLDGIFTQARVNDEYSSFSDGSYECENNDGCDEYNFDYEDIKSIFLNNGNPN